MKNKKHSRLVYQNYSFIEEKLELAKFYLLDKRLNTGGMRRRIVYIKRRLGGLK